MEERDIVCVCVCVCVWCVFVVYVCVREERDYFKEPSESGAYKVNFKVPLHP